MVALVFPSVVVFLSLLVCSSTTHYLSLSSGPVLSPSSQSHLLSPLHLSLYLSPLSLSPSLCLHLRGPALA